MCLLFLHMVRAERGLSNGPPFVGRGLEQQKQYKTCVFVNVCFTHVWFLHTVLNERGLELHSNNCLRPPWSARLFTGLQRKGSRASSEQFLDGVFLKVLGIGPQRMGSRRYCLHVVGKYVLSCVYICIYIYIYILEQDDPVEDLSWKNST